MIVPPTGVNDSASVLELKHFAVKGDLLQFNFPEGLSAHRGIHKLALEGGLVNTTESNLSSVFLRLSHTESEHWLVKETFVHKVIKWRDDLADGNGIITKAKDTVEPRYRILIKGSEGPKGAAHLPDWNPKPDSLINSAKSTSFTVRSPILKTSLETRPAT